MRDDTDLIHYLGWLGKDLPKFFVGIQYDSVSSEAQKSFAHRLIDIAEILNERIADQPMTIDAEAIEMRETQEGRR
jgi:hypothetical protein